MPVNPWLKARLGKAPNPEGISLIVEVEPAAIPAVEAALRSVSGVRVGRRALTFIEVVAPAQAIPQIEAIPGVVMVSYNMPRRIMLFPRSITDPLIGKVSIDDVVMPPSRVGPDLLLPFSPLRWIRTRGPMGDVTIIPTSRSRAVLRDVESPLEGEGVTLAVLDTGWSPQVQILRARAFSTNGSDPTPWDAHGHGSWVTTAAGGTKATGLFGACEGVAPKADLIHVKVLNGLLGFGTQMDIIMGMDLAARLGARVLSLSLGGDECQGGCLLCPECKAVAALARQGVIAVIAAGNCLAESTWIYTPEGHKRVYDLRAGDKVINLNPLTGHFEEDEVTGVYSRWTRRSKTEGPLEEMVTIVTDEGHRLEATEDHPVLVEGRGWVRAAELVPGMHLLSNPAVKGRYRLPRKSGFGGMTPERKDELVMIGVRARREATAARRVKLVCATCEGAFDVRPFEASRRYCSPRCASEGWKGVLRSPASAFLKGVRRSRATEFKKGLVPWNKGLTSADDARVAKIAGAGSKALLKFKAYDPEKAYESSVRGAETVLRRFRRGRYVSGAERVLEDGLLKAGAQGFTPQARIRLGPKWSCIPDFVFVEAQIAVFVDGRFFHSRPGVPERDARIDRRLNELGYMSVRIPSEKVRKNAAPYVAYLRGLVQPSPVDPVIVEVYRRKVRRQVWDVATKKNHTLVANGLVIHNSGPGEMSIGCPGCSPDAVTVGSVSITDSPAVAWFSSRGPSNPANGGTPLTGNWLKPDCLAPGGGKALAEASPDEVLYSGEYGLLEAMYTGIKEPLGFGAMHGTSQSTPAVAGLIACLLGGKLIASADDFKRVCSSSNRQKTNDRGWGVVRLSWFGSSPTP